MTPIGKSLGRFAAQTLALALGAVAIILLKKPNWVADRVMPPQSPSWAEWFVPLDVRADWKNTALTPGSQTYLDTRHAIRTSIAMKSIGLGLIALGLWAST